MDKHIPTKVASSRHSQPGVTSELKRLNRRKKRSYNKQKGKPKNSYDHKRFLKLKRQTEKECKVANNNCMKDFVSPDNTRSTNKFWSYIKSKKNDTIPDKGPSPHPLIENITINKEGVRKMFANLTPHKATV